MQSKRVFDPAHFPPGTVFTIHDDVAWEGQKTFTAMHVVRNGPDSWVVVTTTPSDEKTIQSNKSYNLAWVTSIERRGAGKVVIDQTWYGINHKRKATDAKEVPMMSLPRHNKWVGPRKGHYCTGSVQTVLMHEAHYVFNEGEAVSMHLMVQAVIQQGWCKAISASRQLKIHVINKKKLRAFLKRNRNRFLCPIKQLIEEDRRLTDDYIRSNEDQMFDDMDRELADHEALSQTEVDVDVDVVIRNPVDERLAREDDRFLGALPDIQVTQNQDSVPTQEESKTA